MRPLHYLAACLWIFLLCACSTDEHLEEMIGETNALDQSSLLAAVPAPDVSVAYTDESNFVSSLSSYGFQTPTQVNLNRVGTTSGYNAVYGFNIPANRQAAGFKWNKGDQDTEEWRPQGITGFQWGGKRFLLVTWYGRESYAHKGVRISLVDITNMNNITYRHLLLVQDINNGFYNGSDGYQQLGDFAPVRVHAGGVAYYNQKIYVASTSLGIRVFDLNKIIPASGDATKNRIGRNTDGTLQAFDYRYIVPQTGYYRIRNASPFSCIAVGDGPGSGDGLWTGQYITTSTGGTPKVFGFPLNASGQIASSPSPEMVAPKDNETGNNGPVYNIQGVYRKATTTFMAVTGKSQYEGSTARLVRYTDGDNAGYRWRWPHGAEDLYLEKSTGYLWNLTEYETSQYGRENRCVFAVRLSDYD
ncbi:hypothetical protein [Parapedobacter tibetensis]|uniref:hypothetical protein n=1 Tax=Parapedobacter tibetensis TaxID=2972951 RepID=UPI00214D3D04|nr:hypothetical protein [Parapedobacter tibetensis]